MSKLVGYEDLELSACRKVSIHFPSLCRKQRRKFICGYFIFRHLHIREEINRISNFSAPFCKRFTVTHITRL